MLNKYIKIFIKKNKEDSRLAECIIDLFGTKDEEEKQKNIICILEDIRDNPKIARSSFKSVQFLLPFLLEPFLENNHMEFMKDFLEETVFKDNFKFIDKIFDVIEKHPEVMNYTLILVNQNITTYESFKAIQNILNIEGMDNIFEDIFNAKHNDAILRLIDEKILGGTNYVLLSLINK